MKLISAIKLVGSLKKGHQVFLCTVTSIHSLPKLEDVRVVSEYTDVFPEELPGIPPQRDIEFTIELLLGTGPIAKASYRMAPAEMQELRK